MPATSRQGESASRRSASGLDGLALEVDQLPAQRGAQRLAEVEVAVDRAGHVCRGHAAAAREDLLSASRCCGQLGYDARRGRQATPHRARRSAVDVERLEWRTRRASTRCTSATAAPSRWDSPAKSPPTSSACRSASANRLRALASARSQPSLAVRRNCCSIARCRSSARRVDPAVERSDVAAPGPGQRLVDLDVGVAARGQPAEHLHQAVLAERDRGVALLAGERLRVRRRGRGRARRSCGGTRHAGEVGVACVEGLQPLLHRLTVVHGVVVELRSSRLADEGVADPFLRLGVRRERQLVEVGAAVVVGDRRARCVVSSSVSEHLADVGDLEVPALAAEPAGAGQVGGECLRVRVTFTGHRRPPRVAAAGSSRSRSRRG